MGVGEGRGAGRYMRTLSSAFSRIEQVLSSTTSAPASVVVGAKPFSCHVVSQEECQGDEASHLEDGKGDLAVVHVLPAEQGGCTMCGLKISGIEAYHRQKATAALASIGLDVDGVTCSGRLTARLRSAPLRGHEVEQVGYRVREVLAGRFGRGKAGRGAGGRLAGRQSQGQPLPAAASPDAVHLSPWPRTSKSFRILGRSEELL